MKKSTKEFLKKYIERPSVDISVNNNKMIFTLKNKIPGRKNLIIKHRKTGKRISIPIKKSKAILEIEDLREINELNKYDIYLKVSILNKAFLVRSGYNSTSKGKLLLDYEEGKIFEVNPTIYDNLTFNLIENSFYPKLNSLENISENIILKGEIIPLTLLEFDNIKIISKSNKGGIRVFPCEYEKKDGKILFKSNLKLNDIKEEEIDSYWNLNLRIMNEGFIVGEKELKSNKLSSLKNKENYSLEKISNGEINNIKICTHYLINEKELLKFEIITEEKYEGRVINYKNKDIYNKYKNKKINKNYIFFESFHGKYNNNPKYLYEKMLEMGYDKKYKFIWAYNGEDKLPGNPIIVNQNKEDYYKYLAQSKYRVNNTTFPIIDDRSDIVYLQTWHGTPLKKVGSDVNGGVGWGHFNKEVPTWNYLVSANKYSTKTFKKAFNFDKEVLELGYPANDIFYIKDKSFKENIKNKLNIPKDKKIILYAPTFRDDKKNANGKICFDLELDLEKLREELKSEYNLIIKTHSVVSGSLNLKEELKDFVIDLSNHDDIHELFAISDILITDYSSVFFDFAHSKRPILFFMPDMKSYNTNRGLYQEVLKDLPGPKLTENEEIIKNILSIDKIQKDYKEKYEIFYKKYCNIGNGDSSEKIIKKILK